MTKYDKPPLTIDEQVSLLKSRGLNINNEERIKRHLRNIGYYRLSAYMLPFKKRDKDGEVTDEYSDNTCWDNIIDLYRFDRKLRLILFDSIERIEVALRTQLVYQLAHKYGSHWHDNPNLFAVGKKTDKRTGEKIEVDSFKRIQEHVNKQLNGNSHERFITHYKEKYCSPPTPPAWMTVETMFFSDLSYIFSNLKERRDRVAVAEYFGDLPETIFSSWLHSLNFIRNLCAHHSRVWNKELNIPAAKLNFSKHLQWITNPNTIRLNKIYYVFCIISYLLQTVNPNNTFKEKLKNLFTKFPTINKDHMGFPTEWENEPLWKD